MITDISEQTNLLAPNATSAVSGDIIEIVNNICMGIEKAVEEELSKSVEKFVEGKTVMNQAFRQIMKTSTECLDISYKAKDISMEQSKAVEELTQWSANLNALSEKLRQQTYEFTH